MNNFSIFVKQFKQKISDKHDIFTTFDSIVIKLNNDEWLQLYLINDETQEKNQIYFVNNYVIKHVLNLDNKDIIKVLKHMCKYHTHDHPW